MFPTKVLQVDMCLQFLLLRTFLVQLKILYFCEYEISHKFICKILRNMEICLQNKENIGNLGCKYVFKVKTEEISYRENMNMLEF